MNDEAVKLFLDRKIGFLDIGDLAYRIVHTYENRTVKSVEDVVGAEKDAAALVREIVGIKSDC